MGPVERQVVSTSMAASTVLGHEGSVQRVATRRVAGSTRQVLRRREAFTWEQNAHQSLRLVLVARRWAAGPRPGPVVVQRIFAWRLRLRQAVSCIRATPHGAKAFVFVGLIFECARTCRSSHAPAWSICEASSWRCEPRTPPRPKWETTSARRIAAAVLLPIVWKEGSSPIFMEHRGSPGRPNGFTDFTCPSP